MRIHISDGDNEGDVLLDALRDAQESGRIPSHLYFDVFRPHRSTTHPAAYEVHLGTEYKLPGDKRRPPMRSNSNDFARWSATYDEWGWFLDALYDRDPEAKAGPYTDHADFHAKTRYAFG